MRTVLVVSKPDGTVEKYNIKKVEPTPKKERKSKSLIPKPTPKKVPKVEKMAAKLEMPECKVVLNRLSKSEVDEIIRKSEREHKIRIIKQKIKSLPCKIFLCF